MTTNIILIRNNLNKVLPLSSAKVQQAIVNNYQYIMSFVKGKAGWAQLGWVIGEAAGDYCAVAEVAAPSDCDGMAREPGTELTAALWLPSSLGTARNGTARCSGWCHTGYIHRCHIQLPRRRQYPLLRPCRRRRRPRWAADREQATGDTGPGN